MGSSANGATEQTRGHGNVRALERGLALLREINRAGTIRPGALARNVGLARPTTYRLIETLEELGYVSRSASDNRVRVTRAAACLGDSYNYGSALMEMAGPILHRLGNTLVWPADMVTFELGRMVVQETTHARSPYSFYRSVVGQSAPVLRSAPGRAYLAYCTQSEFDAIIDHVTHVGDEGDMPYLQPPALRGMIEEVRERGFALRHREPLFPTISGIAVPVFAGTKVVACLSMNWLTSAVDLPTAFARFAPPMKDAARELSQRLVAQHLKWGDETPPDQEMPEP